MSDDGLDWPETLERAIRWRVYAGIKCRVSKWPDGRWHARAIHPTHDGPFPDDDEAPMPIEEFLKSLEDHGTDS